VPVVGAAARGRRAVEDRRQYGDRENGEGLGGWSGALWD
jgi:hypothetical protein